MVQGVKQFNLFSNINYADIIVKTLNQTLLHLLYVCAVQQFVDVRGCVFRKRRLGHSPTEGRILTCRHSHHGRYTTNLIFQETIIMS